jgi:hypothetical protein
MTLARGPAAREENFVESPMSLVAYGPHFELPSPELAKWLEQQGADSWWTVDGDPVLSGRLSFPCPGDELAEELRSINQPLLLAAKDDKVNPKGEVISASDLDRLVGYTDGLPGFEEKNGERERWFFLCWKGAEDWFLQEDRLTPRQGPL